MTSNASPPDPPLLRADQIDGSLWPYIRDGSRVVEVYDYDRLAVEVLLQRGPVSVHCTT